MQEIKALYGSLLISKGPSRPGFKFVEIEHKGEQLRFKVARLYRVGNTLKYHDEEVK